MGHGIPFRGATFDGAISVSALQVQQLHPSCACFCYVLSSERFGLTCGQWLCNADFTGANPYKRLNTFFSSLYHTLKRGAKAVLQWCARNYLFFSTATRGTRLTVTPTSTGTRRTRSRWK